jgi:hypothetical protein
MHRIVCNHTGITSKGDGRTHANTGTTSWCTISKGDQHTRATHILATNCTPNALCPTQQPICAPSG